VTEAGSIAAVLAAEAEGPAPPPRANGELVFEAPWESRAFGIAIALVERQAADWEDFRSRLIAEIRAWELEHGDDPAARWSYYERWLASLEALLLQQGLVSKEELDARTEEYATGERDDDWDPDHHH
jgi:nitrile hydratase accessory protein